MSWRKAPGGEGNTWTRWGRGRVERVRGFEKARVFYVKEGQYLMAKAEDGGHVGKMGRGRRVFKGTAKDGVQWT